MGQKSELADVARLVAVRIVISQFSCMDKQIGELCIRHGLKRPTDDPSEEEEAVVARASSQRAQRAALWFFLSFFFLLGALLSKTSWRF